MLFYVSIVMFRCTIKNNRIVFYRNRVYPFVLARLSYPQSYILSVYFTAGAKILQLRIPTKMYLFWSGLN